MARVAVGRVRRWLAPALLRPLLWLAAIAFAVWLLAPRAGQLPQAVAALRSVAPAWLLLGLLTTLLIYLMAAWAQMGAVERPLPLRDTYIAQVAAAFVSQLTPQGLGGMGLNERYLERVGTPRAAAVGGVLLNMAAGAVVHAVALVLFLPWLSQGVGDLRAPVGWPFAVAIALGLALAGAMAGSRWGRRLRESSSARALLGVATIPRRPLRALQLFGGSAGVTGAYALTLVISARACGADAPFLGVVGVYLAAAAVGAAVPSPGGLGAMEAALVAGLVALGTPAGPALAAVLVFRLLTFWLPIAPGFLAFRWMRRRGLV